MSTGVEGAASARPRDDTRRHRQHPAPRRGAEGRMPPGLAPGVVPGARGEIDGTRASPGGRIGENPSRPSFCRDPLDTLSPRPSSCRDPLDTESSGTNAVRRLTRRSIGRSDDTLDAGKTSYRPSNAAIDAPVPIKPTGRRAPYQPSGKAAARCSMASPGAGHISREPAFIEPFQGSESGRFPTQGGASLALGYGIEPPWGSEPPQE